MKTGVKPQKPRQWVIDAAKTILGFVQSGQVTIPKLVMDSANTALFERELENVDQRLFFEDVRELQHQALIPVNSQVAAGTLFYTYYLWRRTGMSKILRGAGDDMPRADIYASRHQVEVYTHGLGYGYTQQELRNSMVAGQPLDASKADAARRGMLEFQSEIAWKGKPELGIPGFITNPNIPEAQVPLNAAATSRFWRDKTGQEILDDLNDFLLSPIRVVTRNKRSATTLGIASPEYELIRTRRITEHRDQKTILQYIMDNTDTYGLQEVVPVPEFEAAAPQDGSNIAMAWEKSPEVLEQVIPMPMTPHAPQLRNLEVFVPVEEELAGTIVRYPLACRKIYSIGPDPSA